VDPHGQLGGDSTSLVSRLTGQVVWGQFDLSGERVNQDLAGIDDSRLAFVS